MAWKYSLFLKGSQTIFSVLMLGGHLKIHLKHGILAFVF